MNYLEIIIVVIIISVMFLCAYNDYTQEQIIYFPDGSCIKRNLIKNLNFYYLMHNPKRKIYFDDYLISVENNTLIVYECTDGDYRLIPEIGKSMAIINGYLF